MKSKVYFTPVGPSDNIKTISEKTAKLLEKSAVLGFIKKKYNVAVKAHFGEEGNTGFVDPAYMKVVCGAIIARGALPRLSDTNTLYRGKRLNSKDHLECAANHGFTKKSTGSEIVIPDDTKKEDTIEVPIDQKFIKRAKLARIFISADAIVAINHFKGHILTGFGGAIKNVGMGCATREGKLAQHCDNAPVVHEDKCTGCGECELVCPADAIRIENKKSKVDTAKCIGCASCLAACPTMAMFIDFTATDKVQAKMAEYALAVLKDKKDRSAFVNFAIKINKECDCWGSDNPRIGPDVGIFASCDPVAIDKASLDMVLKVCGHDIFKEHHPGKDGIKQLEYARELGLGRLEYELITV